MKSQPVVSKFKLSLKKEDILSDIKNISGNENKNNELYSCLEEKPHYDARLNKIEIFLKSSHALEEATENLQSQVDNVNKLKQKVKNEVNTLRDNCSLYTLESQ